MFPFYTPWKHQKTITLDWNGLPFKRQPHKMVKHTQTICHLVPANCLSVFDHFVGLALKELISIPLQEDLYMGQSIQAWAK